jgi:hypothetical protein
MVKKELRFFYHKVMFEGQTFKEFMAKAGDYLNVGILQIWVVDPAIAY